MRQTFEVADIIARYFVLFALTHGNLLTGYIRKTLWAIFQCRTKALGGHANQCNECGHIEDISYNSCRNIHCPKCGGSRRKQWLAQRMQELLPVKYYHIVFTIPHELAPVALQNKKIIYGYLFHAASQTLKELALEHFNAHIGFFAVLHTWGQKLDHHPHLHCVVPCGG